MITKSATIRVRNMHCVSCESIIKDALLEIDGVKNAEVSHTAEKAIVDFDPEKVKLEDIMNAVSKAGYKPEKMGSKPGSFAAQMFRGL